MKPSNNYTVQWEVRSARGYWGQRKGGFFSPSQDVGIGVGRIRYNSVEAIFTLGLKLGSKLDSRY